MSDHLLTQNVASAKPLFSCDRFDGSTTANVLTGSDKALPLLQPAGGGPTDEDQTRRG